MVDIHPIRMKCNNCWPSFSGLPMNLTSGCVSGAISGGSESARALCGTLRTTAFLVPVFDGFDGSRVEEEDAGESTGEDAVLSTTMGGATGRRCDPPLRFDEVDGSLAGAGSAASDSSVNWYSPFLPVL